MVRLQKGNVARVKGPLFDNYNRLCKSVNPWNSQANLAPEASNIPNEIQVLNWGLIWRFHCSHDKQIIEMITEIKFAIINLLIHSWEERLTCFDCNPGRGETMWEKGALSQICRQILHHHLLHMSRRDNSNSQHATFLQTNWMWHLPKQWLNFLNLACHWLPRRFCPMWKTATQTRTRTLCFHSTDHSPINFNWSVEPPYRRDGRLFETEPSHIFSCHDNHVCTKVNVDCTLTERDNLLHDTHTP